MALAPKAANASRGLTYAARFLLHFKKKKRKTHKSKGGSERLLHAACTQRFAAGHDVSKPMTKNAFPFTRDTSFGS